MSTLNFTNPPQSLCIVRLSAIGDVAHVVAIVNRLQQYWPKVKITWIIGKTEYLLVKELQRINFIVFDKKDNLASYKSIYHALKNTHFDVLLMLQAALRASIISLLISARYKVGFDKKRSRDAQWLFSNQRITGPDRVHVVDTFFQFLELLGIPSAEKIWHLPLSGDAVRYANDIIQRSSVVVNPNSSVSRRNWTAKGYAKIIDYLAITLNKQIILTGAPSPKEINFNQAVLKHCTTKNIIDLSGKTHLQQLAAIIKQAELIIAPDTGPAHIATAVNTPAISLFADTNPDRARPYLCPELVVNSYPKALNEFHNSTEKSEKWGFRIRKDNVMELISYQQVIDKIHIFYPV